MDEIIDFLFGICWDINLFIFLVNYANIQYNYGTRCELGKNEWGGTMNFSNEEANALLKMPKYIFDRNDKAEQIRVPSSSPFKMKYNVLSDDGTYQFLLEVNQSAKQSVKISLYVQEDEAKIGLLRIDYSGNHKNPEMANGYVPDFMRAYTGKWFKYQENHIHYHVQGYGPLEWAIPLTADNFPVKEIIGFSSLQQAVLEFLELINLRTKIVFIEERLFL